MKKPKSPKMKTKRLIGSQIALIRRVRQDAIIAGQAYQGTLNQIVIELGVPREKLSEWTLADNDNFIYRIPSPPPLAAQPSSAEPVNPAKTPQPPTGQPKETNPQEEKEPPKKLGRPKKDQPNAE
jgi:hypothetical protein